MRPQLRNYGVSQVVVPFRYFWLKGVNRTSWVGRGSERGWNTMQKLPSVPTDPILLGQL